MRSRRPTLLLTCALAACYVGAEDAELEAGSDEDDGGDDAPAPSALEAPPTRSIALPASGWIDHVDSPIVPWCGAVLIAHDIAVTAARCTEGWTPSMLAVGFGPAGSEPHAIEEVLVQDDVVDGDHALVALRLREPVTDIEPATLDPRGDEVCDVRSVAYFYVVRGDDGGRWLWSGCAHAGTLTAMSGAPNCHGDMGAPAFAPGGALLGIAVDAWSQGGCVTGHRLATVADNRRFFAAALELSQR